MLAEISTSSVEFVRVRVSAIVAGVPVDPTGDPVDMAFIDGDTAPAAPDWHEASWETDATTDPPTYYARCLVGDAVALAAETWTVWVRITDATETPVRRAGLLRVM